eukprot:c16345_g1_i1.p1 GENE.c16345_g1_i1~~c16345_g1_i1.p1  ORF type:complete len:852 (+),score=132.18 c16345_g1_i1:705-3260(+)
MTSPDARELAQRLSLLQRNLHSMWQVIVENNHAAEDLSRRISKVQHLAARVLREDVEEAPTLQPNERVMVRLSTNALFNGRCGCVLSGPMDGRWLVLLDKLGDEQECSLLIKPRDLVRLGSAEAFPEWKEKKRLEPPQPHESDNTTKSPIDESASLPATDESRKSSGVIHPSELDKAKVEISQINFSDGEGWQQFVDLKEVTAFRRPVEGKGIYLYKSVSTIALPYEQFVEMYCDLSYRTRWDETAITIDVVDHVEENEVVYWAVKIPWPMACRDYVYYRLVKSYPENLTVVLSRSAQLGMHKEEVKGFIRVEEFVSNTVIEKVDEKSVRVYCTYMDDPKGSIPKVLVNFASKQAFPRMLDSFHKAFSGYAAYKSNRPQQAPPIIAQSQLASSSLPLADSLSQDPEPVISQSPEPNLSSLDAEALAPVTAQRPPMIENIEFSYAFEWSLVVRAVVYLKRSTDASTLCVVENPPLTLKMTNKAPQFARLVSKDTTLEWLETIRVNEATKELLSDGSNLTWREHLTTHETAAWVSKPNGHTHFSSRIEISQSWLPDRILRLMINKTKQTMVARRKQELALIQKWISTSSIPAVLLPVPKLTNLSSRKSEPEPPQQSVPQPVVQSVPSASAPLVNEDTISSDDTAMRLWALDRSVRNARVSGEARPLPTLEVSWDVNPKFVRNVLVEWIRVGADGHRELVCRKPAYACCPADWGNLLLVELMPMLADGGCGPVAIVEHTIASDPRIDRAIQSLRTDGVSVACTVTTQSRPSTSGTLVLTNTEVRIKGGSVFQSSISFSRRCRDVQIAHHGESQVSIESQGESTVSCLFQSVWECDLVLVIASLVGCTIPSTPVQ